MLMRRCRGLRLADVDVEWEDNFIIRGMKRLRLANGIGGTTGNPDIGVLVFMRRGGVKK